MLLKPEKDKRFGNSDGKCSWIIPICMLAGILFIGTLFGWPNVNPLNTAWVRFGGGDNFQHYIGWRFFRESDWTKHFLFFQNFNYPQGTSVIVTDSNPLFSVIFKLFRSVLPAEFQFNGLWIIGNYALIGFFSAIIGWKLTRNPFQTFVFSMFTILNPVILQRAAIHDTLTAHWLILYAIYICLTDGKRFNWLHWPVLVFFTMMIHVYFLPMIGFIFVLNVIRMISKREPVRKILLLLVVFLLSLAVMYYGAGYNYILPETATYGELSMNLNAFFNPDGASTILQDRESYPLQYEGFNYLGLGFILMIPLSLFRLRKTDIKAGLIFGIPSLLYWMLALSHVITFDKNVLLEISLPDKILGLLSVFRSSGRLAWPFYYIFLGSVFALLNRKENRNSRLFSRKWVLPGALSLLLLVQIVDLSGFLRQFYSRFHEIDQSDQIILNDDIFESIQGPVRHVAVTDGPSQVIDAFSLFAVENGCTFNRSANARNIRPIYGRTNESVHDMIENGTFDKETIYFLLNENDQMAAFEKYPEWYVASDPYPYLYIDGM